MKNINKINKIKTNIEIGLSAIQMALDIVTELRTENERLTNELSILSSKMKEITDISSLKPVDIIETEEVKQNPKFLDFWNIYDKKIGREKCEKLFNKLKAHEVEKIFVQLPFYIESTKDVTYRKHPATWLNGKHWNDEVFNIKQAFKAPTEAVKIVNSQYRYDQLKIDNNKKCEQNRSILNVDDKQLVDICLKTKCRKSSTSKNEYAIKLHKIGYNMGNISIALFGNPGFLSSKTNKETSRYHALANRLLSILPKRQYTDA